VNGVIEVTFLTVLTSRTFVTSGGVCLGFLPRDSSARLVQARLEAQEPMVAKTRLLPARHPHRDSQCRKCTAPAEVLIRSFSISVASCSRISSLLTLSAQSSAGQKLHDIAHRVSHYLCLLGWRSWPSLGSETTRVCHSRFSNSRRGTNQDQNGAGSIASK
jgi:hypothetical protein